VVLPYYSAGFVLFPETHRTPKGQSFPEVWYDTACGIDAIPDLPGKRPYLDQLSLPVAIARAGLGWNELPEERHYILGGVRRRDPLPQDKDISVVHYRRWKVLEWAGIADKGYFYLRKAIGVRRVHRVFSQPAPEDVAR
jgi:hypothetical protein